MPNQSLLIHRPRAWPARNCTTMMHIARELCGGQICVTPDAAAFDDSISVGDGSAWPTGGTPPMAKPVLARTKSASARPIGSPENRADLGLVDAVDARGDDQHRASRRLGAEDQRLGDLRHHAADRRRRLGGGAGARVEFEHLIGGAERGLDLQGAGGGCGLHRATDRKRSTAHMGGSKPGSAIMKLTSILCALSAVFILFAAEAANAKHATVVHPTTSGIHYLNPQPLPP